jgi:hypothetical protein
MVEVVECMALHVSKEKAKAYKVIISAVCMTARAG